MAEIWKGRGALKRIEMRNEKRQTKKNRIERFSTRKVSGVRVGGREQ